MIYLIKINFNEKTKDLFTKNDLFIEIEYGEDKRKTTTIWNNNKPIWNELFISKNNISNMTLKIKDGMFEMMKLLKFNIDKWKSKSFTNDYIQYDIGDIYFKARS